MPPIKPYLQIPIRDCGEALVPIPSGEFDFTEPHPYMALGAPYGDSSPWFLRESVLKALCQAQQNLQSRHAGWKIKLFDAYRPNAVQAFMVERELAQIARDEGFDPTALTDAQREECLVKVMRIWGLPSDNPATPPPHSTGAAVDITLVDETGYEMDMGSPIDENSPRSDPDYFANAADDAGKTAHMHRVLLNDIMIAEGFRRNPREWWHFSRGDQLAVWIEYGLGAETHAIYGRV